MRERISSLSGDATTVDSRVRLLEFVRAMAATHGATLERLIGDHADPALVRQVLEDIGNRYLDLAELMAGTSFTPRAGGGRHLALNY